MDKWRPLDWPERRAEAMRKVILDLQYDKESAFVDAGADAIIEAQIEKYGRRIDRIGYDDNGAPPHFDKTGWFIELFIPDKREEK